MLISGLYTCIHMYLDKHMCTHIHTHTQPLNVSPHHNRMKLSNFDSWTKIVITSQLSSSRAWLPRHSWSVITHPCARESRHRKKILVSKWNLHVSFLRIPVAAHGGLTAPPPWHLRGLCHSSHMLVHGAVEVQSRDQHLVLL